MNSIIKVIIILALLALIFHIGSASTKKTDKMLEAYKNCEPMVDIDGNYQMVCKD